MVILEDGNDNLYYDHELTDIKKYVGNAVGQGHNLEGASPTSVINIIQNALLSSEGFTAWLIPAIPRPAPHFAASMKNASAYIVFFTFKRPAFSRQTPGRLHSRP